VVKEYSRRNPSGVWRVAKSTIAHAIGRSVRYYYLGMNRNVMVLECPTLPPHQEFTSTAPIRKRWQTPVVIVATEVYSFTGKFFTPTFDGFTLDGLAVGQSGS
jgi:hypothetical protein